jgi:sulfur-carrier protein adenylyltransferase/sulfurtransferase
MESEFQRYSCQIALPGFAEESQRRLLRSSVLIVGAGGLGCPAAQYLAAAGVGTIGIADFDEVSLSNLHRQILFTPFEVGMKKATVAANKLQDQNPDISIVPHVLKISSANVVDLVRRYDIIVDCTDNFETKYLLNDACVMEGKPLVFGAIYQFDGQVAVWNVRRPDGTFSPHYRDLFPEVDSAGIPNCAEGGVIPSLAGMIGCMQANEVIKYLSGSAPVLQGKLLLFDARTMESRIIYIGDTSAFPISGLRQSIAVPELSVAELRLCMRNDTVQLVDVRTHEERAQGSLGGIHIPLQDFGRDFSFFNSGRPVVFYCASGKRSEEAARIVLKKFPGARVYSLAGGLKSWIEKS